MTDSLVIVGAGGFGREVIDVVDAINRVSATWNLLGVVDDAPSVENLSRLRQRDVPYLGTVDDVVDGPDCSYVVGIGSPSVRMLIADRLDAADFAAATLVHPTATCGFDVTLGAGTVLCAGVSITTNVHLGRHVHVNPAVTIGHDTTIGDFVSLNPRAAISGDCVIDDGALVGVAGVVLNRLRVGANSVVGGGACVVRDVPPGAVVKGVPAR